MLNIWHNLPDNDNYNPSNILARARLQKPIHIKGKNDRKRKTIKISKPLIPVTCDNRLSVRLLVVSEKKSMQSALNSVEPQDSDA